MDFSIKSLAYPFSLFAFVWRILRLVEYWYRTDGHSADLEEFFGIHPVEHGVYGIFHSVTLLKLKVWILHLIRLVCFRHKDAYKLHPRIRREDTDKFHTRTRREDTDKFHPGIRRKATDRTHFTTKPISVCWGCVCCCDRKWSALIVRHEEFFAWRPCTDGELSLTWPWPLPRREAYHRTATSGSNHDKIV
jgi:hypothetical protein